MGEDQKALEAHLMFEIGFYEGVPFDSEITCSGLAYKNFRWYKWCMYSGAFEKSSLAAYKKVGGLFIEFEPYVEDSLYLSKCNARILGREESLNRFCAALEALDFDPAERLVWKNGRSNVIPDIINAACMLSVLK